MRKIMRKIMKKFMLSLVMVLISVTMLADNGTTKVMEGKSKNNVEYTVHLTEDVYYFQGNEYTVYNVDYTDSLKDVKIAVHDNCYIVYNKDFTIFYGCDKNGFGVRRCLFTNPTSGKSLNAREYSRQTILVEKDITEYDALGLIAMFFPSLELNETV